MEKYKNLKKNIKNVVGEKWSLENLKDGFEYFKELNGRYPGSIELDSFEFLPNRKMIERRFGGLQQLRSVLGYEDVHFGKGKFRSEIALRVNKRGRASELALERILKNKFGEVFVHTEKIFDDSRNRVDFYVYSPDGNFGVDIFNTDTMLNLQNNINIKIDKYKNFSGKLFYVVANDNFSQDDIDLSVLHKKKIFSNNGSVIVNLKKFYEIIGPMKSYPKPF